jgi:hypothetical protein
MSEVDIHWIGNKKKRSLLHVVIEHHASDVFDIDCLEIQRQFKEGMGANQCQHFGKARHFGMGGLAIGLGQDQALEVFKRHICDSPLTIRGAIHNGIMQQHNVTVTGGSQIDLRATDAEIYGGLNGRQGVFGMRKGMASVCKKFNPTSHGADIRCTSVARQKEHQEKDDGLQVSVPIYIRQPMAISSQANGRHKKTPASSGWG